VRLATDYPQTKASQAQMTWWQKLELFLASVTALATAIAGYATYRTFKIQRRTAFGAHPTLALPTISRSKKAGTPHSVQFKLDDQYISAWQVDSVQIQPAWRPLISAIDSIKRDVYGDEKRIEPVGWKRRLIFDPPKFSSTILVQSDCPKRFTLLFRMSMRAAPNERSRFAMPIKIRD
jgi:hypothetical protein